MEDNEKTNKVALVPGARQWLGGAGRRGGSSPPGTNTQTSKQNTKLRGSQAH